MCAAPTAPASSAVGTWDHWVPGASEVLSKLCREWADKEKVDLTFDLITSNGDKDLLTLMARGRRKSGHDIMGLRTWYVSAHADKFVPVDDVVDPVIRNTAESPEAAEYLGKIKGRWMAVPTCYGSAAAAALRPHRLCSRNMRARPAEDVPGRGYARQGADRSAGPGNTS